MHRSAAFLASLLPTACYLALPQRQSVVDYATDVAPILRAHCSPCHTGQGASGGLSLNSFESLIKGGISGPSVVKGLPAKSVLIQRILGEGGKPRMPMGFKPLADEDVAKIRQWIAAGAPPPSLTTPKEHWAFAVPRKPSVPNVAGLPPIDAFILEKLRANGLSFSPPADRRTLLRRVTLDLTGLPPKPEEIEAFLRDQKPGAYERVVDRLLASPHYGERMALPWLDAARYADSNGFQQDGDTYQYVWRDWVVKALNDNMPFDRFTIEQIAGDLLPNPSLDQLVATGFNRNHMLNGEGGAIPEEQRFVNLFDRVDTTSMTWLGLTMGCARCHDHKYDPLSQRDYYSMMAYFNRVPETGVPSGSGQYRIAEPWVYAGTPAEMARMDEARRRVEATKRALDGFQKGPEFENRFQKWRQELPSMRIALSPWSEVGSFEETSFDAAFDTDFGPEKGVVKEARERADLEDGRVHPLTGDNRAFYFRRTVQVDKPTPVLLSLGSDDGIRVFIDGRQVFARKATRAALPDSDKVLLRLMPGPHTIVLKIVNGGGVGGFYFKAFPGGADSAITDLARLRTAYIENGVDEAVARLRADLADAEAELARSQAGIPRVMVMSDAKPRPTHVLHRGNYDEPAEPVEADTPTAFFKVGGPTNRLSLAKWIVSEKNPLTARVQVNRAWQTFFGRGLVRTEENFGVKGEPPTHPKLLDWLAVDFRESGWNLKRLHRMIVLSRTYRQSSRITAGLLRTDPDNRLYARAPRLRLPAMLLRDLALASSGLLERRMGGKPVYPYQPPGIWDGLAITKERDFTYPQSKGKDLYRRSLYTFWRRTAAPGNMFDSASRQVCTVNPTVTSSPLHALTTLNDVTWVECGVALADSLAGLSTLEARLQAAFLKVCGRTPKPDELVLLRRSFERARGTFEKSEALSRQFLSQGEFRPQTMTAEVAALAAVCVSIYNLDEAITRG